MEIGGLIQMLALGDLNSLPVSKNLRHEIRGLSISTGMHCIFPILTFLQPEAGLFCDGTRRYDVPAPIFPSKKIICNVLLLTNK